MIITVVAAWPPGRPEDSKEGDQKRKESRSFVPTKYVTYKFSSVTVHITKDRRWKKRESRLSRLAPHGEATISVSVNLGQCITEITLEMKGECRLNMCVVNKWDFSYSPLLH